MSTDTPLASSFVQASYYSPGSNGLITRVVLHDEEYPVSAHSAEDVAQFFARPGAQGSAHYVVDADSIVQCVRESQIAYHAPPNPGSIGIEHDGYARFTAQDWLTPGSQATLARSALLTAELCRRYHLPVVWLSPQDLLDGKRGITGHAAVTAAWHESDHTDPGLHFPVQQYLNAVRAHLTPQPSRPDQNPYAPHRLVRLLGDPGPPVFLLSLDGEGLYRMHVPDQAALADTTAKLRAGNYVTDVLPLPQSEKARLAAIRQLPWKALP